MSEIETRAGTLGASTVRDPSLADARLGDAGPAMDRISRYVILSRLGAGAMGVVYAAYDPELDRKVAVKLIKASRERASESAKVRLLREAQALAKLDHPNVVPVHDAGDHEGEVFIAMKFVEGRTVGEWLSAEPRPDIGEILRVFILAGRGLSAAHARGMVHRDFKPDNVMIGRDGDVRVMDFGLVRSADDDEGEDDPADDFSHANPLDPRLTRTGALLGTPAYMAPELFTGGTADARSDQFAFGVSLYEGLYGERPYGGDTVASVMLHATEGKVQAAPANSKVPLWLRKVVLRGISARAADRWPSMNAMLQALAADPVRRRRRSIVMGGGAITLAGLAVAAGFALQATPSKCEGMDRHLVGVWDDSVKASIEQRVAASELAYAADSWKTIEPRIDAWAEDWVSAREDACADTHQRGEQSAAMLDLRMACLDEGLTALRATGKVLASADDETLGRMSKVVDGLSDLSPCADPEYLSAEIRPPTDPAEVQKVAEIKATLADSNAQSRAGKTKEALATAERAQELAENTEHGPTKVSVGITLAQRQSASGDYEGSVATAREAYFEAVRQRLHHSAGVAARSTVYTLGYYLGRTDEAVEWARHAQANLGSEPDPRLESSLGATLLKTGDYEAARPHLERALKIYTEQEGADSHVTATVHMNLSALCSYEGKNEESLEHSAATLRGYANFYGPDHPELGLVHLNRGGALAGLARFDEAKEATQKAREILEAAHGPEHNDVALARMNLGMLAYMEGDQSGALEHTKAALEIKRKVLGDDSTEVADLWLNVGSIHAAMGNQAEAESAANESLRIAEKVHGPQHQKVGAALTVLASAAAVGGDYETAADLDRRALDIQVEALGENHPTVAETTMNVASNLRKLGELDEATKFNELALTRALAAGGEKHPRYARVVAQSAKIQGHRGRFDEARTRFAEAVKIHEDSQGKEDQGLIPLMIMWSNTEMDARSPERAVPLAERGLSIATKSKAEVTDRAALEFLLARALWDAPTDQGRDRPRARTLAESARSSYAEAGSKAAEELDEVDRWLEKHSG